MSGSIGDVAAQPLIPEPAPGSAPVLSPYPSGPPTSSSPSAASGAGSVSSTANPDGSLTTVVVDATGNTISVSVSPPAPAAIAAAHPLVSFEA